MAIGAQICSVCRCRRPAGATEPRPADDPGTGAAPGEDRQMIPAPARHPGKASFPKLQIGVRLAVVLGGFYPLNFP